MINTRSDWPDTATTIFHTIFFCFRQLICESSRRKYGRKLGKIVVEATFRRAERNPTPTRYVLSTISAGFAFAFALLLFRSFQHKNV